MVALGFHVSATEWELGDCPAPLRATVAGEFVALLAIVTLAPVPALPALLGENVTVSVVDCPGVRIAPPETPLELKPAPVT